MTKIIIYNNEKLDKETFNLQPRGHQWMIASINGLKPEKRIRDKKTENLVKKQSGRTLELAPDSMPDYYWSDSRDLFEEIYFKQQVAKDILEEFKEGINK